MSLKGNARVDKLMTKIDNAGLNDITPEKWPGIDSRFRLVVLAGLRSKQLFRGSEPRIPSDPLKRRNTSIALEELKQGLVTFTSFHQDQNEIAASNG